MTKQELVDMLDEVSRVLLLNKEAAKEETLDEFEQVITSLEQNFDDLTLLFSADTTERFRRYLKVSRKVLDIEKRLVDNKLGDQLFEVVTKLRDKPLILNLIAALF